MGEQTSLTIIQGCGDLNKSLALYACYDGSLMSFHKWQGERVPNALNVISQTAVI